MKQIKCKSGITGWQDYLKSVYSSKEEFLAYNDIYGIAKRFGYNDAEACWNANPLVEGSTDPSDLRVSVKRNSKTSLIKGTHF